MKKVMVAASKTYDVLIGQDILKDTGSLVASVFDPCKLCIITDSTVDALYADIVEASLKSSGFTVCKFVFASGEQSKNIKTYNEILEYMAGQELTRSDAIIALGGGVAGDLAGFAAASYLRGIPFVQIPTTLLAAVDSSVGGKTGINLSHGKNLAGAFWQPSLVLCDCSTFATLPQSTILDGVAETIKYGMILDQELFEFLSDKTIDFFTDLSPEAATATGAAETLSLESVVERCVSLKRDVVMEDERDTGKRQLLNFGHTIGHAVEKCSNFQISHGHAVAIGMLIVSRAAFEMNLVPNDCSKSVKDMLIQFGFSLICPYSSKQLADAALMDKKRTNREITLVLPYAVGDCRLKKIEVTLLEPFIGKGLS